MAKADRWWALVRPSGEVGGCICIAGSRRPLKARDNPEGLEPVRVNGPRLDPLDTLERTGDIDGVSHGKWKRDKTARARADRAHLLRHESRSAALLRVLAALFAARGMPLTPVEIEELFPGWDDEQLKPTNQGR